MDINGRKFEVIRLLGKGKGGYSYLVTDGKDRYVLKQIHHEPCDYYTFGDKIAAEQGDYIRLQNAGIPLPQMLDIDIPNERILKEYIPGPTIFQLVKEDRVKPEYFHQVRHMAWLAQQANLNIDYFPTNFVVWDDRLWYVDYECNSYDPRWNFENWGNDYWWKSPTFLDYVNHNKDL